MRRLCRFLPWPLVLGSIAMSAVTASASPETLVLPLRSTGVSETTVAVVSDLLRGELERRGVAVVATSRLDADLPRGESACDDAECAAAVAERYGAARVVYGSLSRLGEKIIVRILALREGETAPSYVDQIAASSEEDLDAVVRRVADGIASGRPNADRAEVGTVTREETFEPRRRASHSALGLRAGFLFPVADSYGGTDRLTSARLTAKYETPDYVVESTPILGFAWRGGTLEWTVLDVFAAHIFGKGDLAPTVGAGLGVHTVRVEKRVLVTYPSGGTPYTYYEGHDQSETTLTADVGVGLLALRTYDFSIVVDLRYHYVAADFGEVGGKGAHGISITFGTSR